VSSVHTEEASKFSLKS